MMDIKQIETGSSMSQAFREIKYRRAYCNLVAAGETSGMIDSIRTGSRPTGKDPGDQAKIQ